MESQKRKNIKPVVALIALSLSIIVGATFAYFSSSSTFENEFFTGKYRLVTTEEFESPNNWAPGQEIPKTIVTANEGDITAAVRVKFEEKWFNGETEITNQISANTVSINFDNTNEWVRHGDYYYYKFPLKPGETTSSFIKSVTLSPDINSVQCTTSQDGKSQVCESTNQAIGATYKLIFTKETVQYDAYQTVWINVPSIEARINPIITNRQVEDTITIGDEICIQDECFNVISSDANNVAMLAKYNLNVGNNIQTGTQGIQNANAIGWNSDNSTMDGNNNYPATVSFVSSDYWPTIVNYPADVYNTNNPTNPITAYVNNYKAYLQGLGARIQEARLLTYTEAQLNPSFLRNTSFWLGTAESSSKIYEVSSVTGLYRDTYSNAGLYGIRPVIVIPINTIQES